MAGLYSVAYDTKSVTPSLTQLDDFLDWVAPERGGGTLKPRDLLTIALSFRAIDIIAGAVSRMPFGVFRGDTDVTEEATPRYWKDLNYKLCASLLVFNAAYCLKETNTFGHNTRWRFLVAPNMRPDIDLVTGKLTGFHYGSQAIDDYEKSLLWWWWPNILAEVGPGTGPVNAALGDATLIKYLTDFASAYFLRGGFPVTLLFQDGPINPKDQDRLESFWNALVAGAKRAFRFILLSRKLTVEKIGSSIKETIAPELYDQSARNVAIAFGIPLSVLMSDAANYATALEDHVRLYSETVLPIYDRIAEVWNERVYEPQGLILKPLPRRLEVMQQNELQKAQALSQLVGGKAIMTVDEARAMLEMEPMLIEAAPVAPPVAVAPDRDDTIAEDGAAEKDWQRFERKARNALVAGKSASVTFASDVLLASEVDTTRARLRMCRTPEDIKAVFSMRSIPSDRNDDIVALIGVIDELKAMRDEDASRRTNDPV